ncbi:MAG: Hsp20/alpha crystallin family protein [Nanoarchaeota archaeon]
MFNAPTLRDGTSRMMKNFDDAFSRFFDFPMDMFDTQFFGNDIYASDENTLCIDVPGFNKDNLNVEYQNGVIMVTGENDFGRKIQKKIRIGRDIGEPKSAEIKDGVLKLEYEAPQTEENKRKIELE